MVEGIRAAAEIRWAILHRLQENPCMAEVCSGPQFGTTMRMMIRGSKCIREEEGVLTALC